MKSKKRKNYTKAFKEEAVKLITDQGYSFAEAGRNLGVNPNLISRWKRESDGGDTEMRVSRSGYYAWKNTEKSKHQEENESLIPIVLEAHRVSRGSYGARRMATDSKHNLPVVLNLLNRNFETGKPNEVWVGEITYVWTAEGLLYLAVVIDLFSRKVVGWAMSNRIKKDLVIESITMATGRREISPGLIFILIGVVNIAAISFKKFFENKI